MVRQGRPVLLVVLGIGIIIPLAAALFGGEGIGPILVIGFIVLSFVFSGRLAVRMLRSTHRTDITERGIPGTAIIRSIRETGTSINNHPMPEFELEVTLPGRPDYSVTMKQVLPRLLLGQVRPGITVKVKALAEDPQQVAIDWDAVAGGEAADNSPTIKEGLFAGAAVTGTISARDFLARAVRGQAEIDQMSETGQTAPDPRTGADLEVFAFVVTVELPGKAPYEARLLQTVPAELAGRIGPGARVIIGVNPDDPGDVAVDWEALQASEEK